MFQYHAYGLDIHSEIALPELILKKSPKPDMIIRLGAINPFIGNALNEGVYFRETKKAKYRFWDDIGIFKISNGNEIVVDPANRVDELILRKFLLGTVFANLLHQRGFMVLHASAVKINNSAVAFLGEKNSGKSTTAFEFYKNGYSVIADDYIPIQFENKIPSVYPGFPQLKLSEKSLSNSNFKNNLNYSSKFEKFYFSAKKYFEQSKLPLKNVYVLERAAYNAITSFKPQESFIKLTKNNFGITRYKSLDLNRSFLQCEKLMENVKIKRLEIGEFEDMDQLVGLVEEDI
jgi:hypothetical protein